MKKTIITVAALATFLVPVAAGAFTQEEGQQNREERKLSIEDRRNDLQNNRDQKIDERCKRIESKIEERKNRFEEGKTRRINAYDNMLVRIEKLAEKLKAKGYDVSKLETDIKILETKIEKFKTDYATFIASLGQTREFACGKSDGEFKGKLGEARKNLPTLRADVKDIHDFFRTTIKADFKAIRDQKVETDKTPETPDTSSNE